ncbi:MAG: hypothetical protein JG762_541 [Deferribacteraceae bacterium]|jgi:hypothetical protein|nr:hypothetical protein [Deferribacteraceae bacterium]
MYLLLDFFNRIFQQEWVKALKMTNINPIIVIFNNSDLIINQALYSKNVYLSYRRYITNLPNQ